MDYKMPTACGYKVERSGEHIIFLVKHRSSIQRAISLITIFSLACGYCLLLVIDSRHSALGQTRNDISPLYLLICAILITLCRFVFKKSESNNMQEAFLIRNEDVEINGQRYEKSGISNLGVSRPWKSTQSDITEIEYDCRASLPHLSTFEDFDVVFEYGMRNIVLVRRLTDVQAYGIAAEMTDLLSSRGSTASE